MDHNYPDCFGNFVMSRAVKPTNQPTESLSTLHSAVLRFISEIGFSDLGHDELASIANIANFETQGDSQVPEGFKEYIASELRSRKPSCEKSLRNRFEGQLQQCGTIIMGLEEFTRDPAEYPLSAQLCTEWLGRFSNLPLEIERRMVECIFFSPLFDESKAVGALREIAEQRLAQGHCTAPPSEDRIHQGTSPVVAVAPLHSARKKTEDDRKCYWTAVLCILDSMPQRSKRLSRSTQKPVAPLF